VFSKQVFYWRNEMSDVLVPSQSEVKVLIDEDGLLISRPFHDMERYSSDQPHDVSIEVPRHYLPQLLKMLQAELSKG
jgi:hypothetical protein